MSSKRAEAQQVLSQIQEIDASLDKAIDAYNASQIRLDAIRAEQRTNQRHLAIVRDNFANAQSALQNRLIALYTSGDDNVLEVLLGSKSLSELLDRVDTVSRVSAQDERVIREIVAYKTEIKEREKKLALAWAEQEKVLAERAAQRRQIEGQLAERQRLLASIKSEIKRIQAAEAERQRRLQAEAERRLQEQQQQEQEQQERASSSNASNPSSAPSPSPPSTGGSSEFTPDGAGGAAAPPAATYGGVVGIAMQYLGTPYVWGGASPNGFDCSGFVMFVYAKVGVSLPHNAAMQYGYGSPVSRSDLQPGDLVFFNGLGHNGIYIGGNQFIHSPHSGDVVKISTISDWYADTWVGARRL